MQIDKQSMVELAQLVAESVVIALEKRGIVGQQRTSIADKSAYAKTESLLYNYVGLKKIVAERMAEIEELQKYGVPKKNNPFGERVQASRTVQGIVLEEESVESAVRNVLANVQGTIDAINLIDKSMAALSKDPYYKVLEMRYFEGRTLEDIALEYNCDHSTISRNKSRLVRELAMRIFPDLVVDEMIN